MRLQIPAWLVPDRWLAGGCLLVSLLALAMALNFANTHRQQQDARAVAHTHDVIDAVGGARTSVRTLQAVERGLLFTERDVDTRDYVAASEEAQQAVRHLGELLERDPLEQERFENVSASLQQLLDFQRATLVKRQVDGVAAARERSTGEESERLVEGVNAQLRTLELSERVLLEQRAASADHAYHTALVTGLITGFTSILLVIGFATLLRRHMVRTTADARELRVLSEELREADRRKDRFLATLAHELRNPLAPVRTAATILDSPQLDETRFAWCRTVIKRQVAQMARLLDDLLDVARITQEKFQLRLEPVRLASVIDVAVEAARPVIERKHHVLEVRAPAQQVTIEVDAVRISQALTNLLTNAAKYTDPKGRIELAAEVEGHALRFTVRDNGIGIEPKVLDRIFHMFAQVDSESRRAEGGLGIGLALARGVVDLHGGSIAAHSDGVGRGSAFVIDLPDVVLDAEPVPTAAPAAPDAAPNAMRILVVDDHRDAAEALALVLRMEGHDVEAADSGSAALRAAKASRFDVAFVDIGMPDLDGLQVARALRDTPEGRRIALVALTGWGEAEDRQRSLAAGFDAHLTKPVDPATIRALLSQPLTELTHARSAISAITHD